MTVTVSGSNVVFNDSTTQTTAFTGSATTATNLAGGSNGTIPYQSASGTTQMLAAGTSGQVLTSAGSSSAPTWTTPSAGAMSLISTLTANNTSNSLIWTGLTGYNKYILIFDNLQGASGAGSIGVLYGYGSTPTYITSGYSTVWYLNNSSTSITAGTNSAVGFAAITKSAGNINSGFITFTGFTSLQSVLSSGSSMAQASASPFNLGVSTVAASVSSGGVPITALKLNYEYNDYFWLSGTASLYGISS